METSTRDDVGTRDLQKRGSVLLLCVLSACSLTDSLKARRIAREGNALYRASDYRGARAKYREAIALDAKTPNVHLNLGFTLFNLYNPESEEGRAAAKEAVASFEENLRQMPADERARSFQIKTLLRAAPHDSELADQAFSLFNDILKTRPHDAEVRQYLTSLFIETKRYAQAVEFFAPEIEKQDLAAMKILSVVADKCGNHDEAISWYQRRAEAAPREQKATLYYELATYLWKRLHDRPDQTAGDEGIRLASLGIAAAERAIALRPEYGEAYVYANLLYLERAARATNEKDKLNDENTAYELRLKATKLLAGKETASVYVGNP